jgi:hypothetical protein
MMLEGVGYDGGLRRRMVGVRYEGVSDEDILSFLVNATKARAERKSILLAKAARDILKYAERDFDIPVERLPSPSDIVFAVLSAAVPGEIADADMQWAEMVMADKLP